MDSKSPFKNLPLPMSVARGFLRQLRIKQVQLRNYGRVQFGDYVVLGPGARISVPEHASFGNRVAIGGNFISQTNLYIGDDCLLSSNVSFIGNDHFLEESESMFFSGRAPASETILEGNNFIGFNATLLGNIKIGQGSIVGACSLVLKDVPPDSIVAGVPAKVIRKREFK